MAETRVALVTGGNRGIGLEIVRQLSRLGVITVLGSRDVAKGQAAAAALASEGLEVPVLAVDADDPHSAVRIAQDIKSMFGRCDILVNNAAILIDGPGGFDSSLFDMTTETMRRTFETNVMGPARLIQAIVPLMRDGGYGRIVNLSSGAGQLSDMGKGFPAYRMSKSALNALTKSYRQRTRRHQHQMQRRMPGLGQNRHGRANCRSRG